MPLNNPIAGTRLGYGEYTGNSGVANRAIPHGLTKTPAMVFIYSTSGNRWFFRIMSGLAAINHSGDATVAPSTYGVTAPDTTNFYVGNGVNHIETANNTTYPYYWVAIG